jgi:hypothetical protein
LYDNLDGLRKEFETHLEDLSKLTPAHDEKSFTDVYARTKATTTLFKANVRLAEKRIREGKPPNAPSAKKRRCEAIP